MEVKEEPESGGIEHVLPAARYKRSYLFQDQDKAVYLTSINQENAEPKLLLTFHNILRESLPNMHPNDLYEGVFSIANEILLLFVQEKLIGGLVFNLESIQFAQIVFLAIAPSYRSKGRGSFLMNVFKTLLQQRQIKLTVTHADNSSKAFYFKHGFSETEFISNSHWASQSQHYYFSTKMQCLIHPKDSELNYFQLAQSLKQQKQLIMDITKTHCLDIKPYYTTFPQKKQPFTRSDESNKEYFLVNPESLDGVTINGWNWDEYKKQILGKNTWAYRLYAEFFPLLYSMAEPELKQFKDSPHVPLNGPRDLNQLADKVMAGVYDSTADFWHDLDLFLIESKKYYKRHPKIVQNLAEIKNQAASMRKKMK